MYPNNYSPYPQAGGMADLAGGLLALNRQHSAQSNPGMTMVGDAAANFGGMMQGAMGQMASTLAGNQAAAANARNAAMPLELAKIQNQGRLQVLDRLSPLIANIFGRGQSSSVNAPGAQRGFVSNFGQMAIPTDGNDPTNLFNTIYAARRANALPIS